MDFINNFSVIRDMRQEIKIHHKLIDILFISVAAFIAGADPEIVAPVVLEKDKKDTILYILMDGSAVNTRVQDEDGSTWKEMKLGVTFLLLKEKMRAQ